MSANNLRPTAQPFVPGVSQQQQQQSPGSAQVVHTPSFPVHSQYGLAPAPYQPMYQQPSDMIVHSSTYMPPQQPFYSPLPPQGPFLVRPFVPGAPYPGQISHGPVPYYSAAPRPLPKWNLRSRVSYEILRTTYPPPKGFYKPLWNEASFTLKQQYPKWELDPESREWQKMLKKFYKMMRDLRLKDEKARDQKALRKQKVEEPNRPNDAEEWVEEFNADTRRQLAALTTEEGAVQDAHSSPSAGSAGSPSHSPEEVVVAASAPQAEAAEATEKPEEEKKPTDPRQQIPKPVLTLPACRKGLDKPQGNGSASKYAHGFLRNSKSKRTPRSSINNSSTVKR
ncbi:hypothetical protein PG993_002873 [Apiospora rasikravindrae]|uniref:HMG box domain-containing protein n=1 Tax=Apiospora rasikravindrae TaxID=990691 RepID=A0ABR1TY34_9PEZI